MACYIVLNYDVQDKEMFEKYVPAAMPVIAKHGAKILAADRDPQDIEGASRQALVILEFESEEAAKGWYNSPEYQAVVKLRTESTEGWARLVPEFVNPQS